MILEHHMQRHLCDTALSGTGRILCPLFFFYKPKQPVCHQDPCCKHQQSLRVTGKSSKVNTENNIIYINVHPNKHLPVALHLLSLSAWVAHPRLTHLICSLHVILPSHAPIHIISYEKDCLRSFLLTHGCFPFP